MAKKKTEELIATQCPLNPRWVISMLAILPQGSRGKLEAYKNCKEVAEGLKEKARLLGKTLTDLGYPELEERNEEEPLK